MPEDLACDHAHIFTRPKGLILSEIWARRFRPAAARCPAHFNQKTIKMATEVWKKRLSPLWRDWKLFVLNSEKIRVRGQGLFFSQKLSFQSLEVSTCCCKAWCIAPPLPPLLTPDPALRLPRVARPRPPRLIVGTGWWCRSRMVCSLLFALIALSHNDELSIGFQT